MIFSSGTGSIRLSRIITILVLLVLGFAKNSQAAHSVDLAWDPDTTTPQLAGYKLYFGNLSGSYDQLVNVGASSAVTIPNLQAGTTYYFVVTEYDTNGLESQPSNEVSFDTEPDAIPSVSLSNPGGTINGPADITLTAAASAANASIIRLDFYANGSKIGSTSLAPYTLTWKNVQPGNYGVSAVAFDSNGLSASSALAPLRVVAFQVTGLSRVSNGAYQLTVTGAPGSNYDVYISEDLSNWRLAETVANPSGSLTYVDATSSQVSRRFYRFAVHPADLNTTTFKTSARAQK